MHKAPLHTLIIGFTTEQHIALVKDLKSAHKSLRVNDTALKPDAFDSLIKRSRIDVVFLKYTPKANFQPLYKRLYSNNQDCIVVELIDPLEEVLEVDGALQAGIQKCRVIHDTEFREFHLALQFVMQYVMLKKDFRRCKSLLYLSESRVSRLVDSSNLAIAFIAEGKIMHANIAFMVMFSAESLAELKRFSLLKLIAQDEHELFANYLAKLNRSPKFNADLVLTMRRTSGAPFNAKVQASRVVSKGKRCYQLWVEQRTQDYQEELIPVTKALNIWDMPVGSAEKIEVNPFDRVLTSDKHSEESTESSLEVLQKELINDNQVKLRFRELYEPGRRALNTAWAKLDIDPEDFRMINSLLSRNTSAALPVFASFWDQLTFKLVFEALKLETISERTYLITLSANMIADSDMMVWLHKLLQQLDEKTKQLVLVIDAEMPMNRIPQTHKVVDLLRDSGCRIALNNFSVDTTPLFLFKHIKPMQVILDSEWIDELKDKNDDGLFIKRFVRNLESLGVSVLIPQAQQKHQDRLFVLTGTSFGQEIPTQDCA